MQQNTNVTKTNQTKYKSEQTQVQQNTNITKYKRYKIQMQQNIHVTKYKCNEIQTNQNTNVTKCVKEKNTVLLLYVPGRDALPHPSQISSVQKNYTI